MTEKRGQKWEGVYISIGSNLGDREGNIKKAIELIGESPGIRIGRASLLYETEPVGREDQGWFLNQVIEVSTTLSPQELLGLLGKIETTLGRTREERWGPRRIDLDILLFGDLIVDLPELKIPHPELHKRNFTLIPLAEIAPETRDPLLNRSIEDLLLECADTGEVRRWQR